MNLDEYDIEKMSGDEVKEAVLNEMRQEQFNKFKLESRMIAKNLMDSREYVVDMLYNPFIQRNEWVVYPKDSSKEKEFYRKLEEKYPLLSRNCIHRTIQHSLTEANNRQENERRSRENRKTKIENAVAISLLVMFFGLFVSLIIITICKGAK